MLARRFTIVCLLVALFGMSLSILVAEKSRPEPRRPACDYTQPWTCPSALER